MCILISLGIQCQCREGFPPDPFVSECRFAVVCPECRASRRTSVVQSWSSLLHIFDFFLPLYALQCLCRHRDRSEAPVVSFRFLFGPQDARTSAKPLHVFHENLCPPLSILPSLFPEMRQQNTRRSLQTLEGKLTGHSRSSTRLVGQRL